MEFVVKECIKCKLQRKFLKGSLRDIKSICGNCWNWEIEDDANN